MPQDERSLVWVGIGREDEAVARGSLEYPLEHARMPVVARSATLAA